MSIFGTIALSVKKFMLLGVLGFEFSFMFNVEEISEKFSGVLLKSLIFF